MYAGIPRKLIEKRNLRRKLRRAFPIHADFMFPLGLAPLSLLPMEGENSMVESELRISKMR
jgi:hypothetical protein